MAKLVDNTKLQHYASKICNAENRKHGDKPLPAVLNEIDIKIDNMKAIFEEEYGSAVNMKLINEDKIFRVGKSNGGVDKSSDVENSFTDVEIRGTSLVNLIRNVRYNTAGNYLSATLTPLPNGCRYVKNDTVGVFYPRIDINQSSTLLKPSTTYSFIIDIVRDNPKLQGLNVSKGDDAYLGYTKNYRDRNDNIANGRLVFWFTTPTKDLMTDKLKIGFSVFDMNAVNKFVEISNIMLLEGDYTNKPLPDYFEGIQSVGRSANELDISKASVIKGKYLHASSGEVLNGASNGRILDFYPIASNVFYSISKSKGNKNHYALYDINKVFITGGVTTLSFISFLAPPNAKFVRCYWSDVGDEIENSNLQIEQSAQPTIYNSYSSGNLINVTSTNRNLFNLEYQNHENIKTGFSCSIANYDNRECWRLQQQDYTERYNTITSDFKELTQYYFTLKCKMTSISNDSVSVRCYIFYTDGTASQTYINKNSVEVSLVSEPGKTVSYVRFGSWTYAGTLYLWDITLAEGNEPKYIPFEKDIKNIRLKEPLRGLPNGVKDSIELVDGKWKLIRRCGVFVYGDTSWTYHLETDNTLSCFRSVPPDQGGTITDTSKICESFQHKFWSGGFNNEEHHWTQVGASAGFIILKSRLSTPDINGFRKWFLENPTKVIYQLKNPTIEDIDDITLQCWKGGGISIDTIPTETSHVVALNKSAQIQSAIVELTDLRNRVSDLENLYDDISMSQTHKLSLLEHSMRLDF